MEEPGTRTRRLSAPDTSDVGALTKEVSVLDGVFVLARHQRLILWITVASIALGVFVALMMPREYLSSAVLMREAQEEPASGSLAALRGLGFNLGSAQAGLTIEAYPDVLMSHEVRGSLIREEFPLANGDRVSFVEYHQDLGSSSLTGWLRGLFGSPDLPLTAPVDSQAVVYSVVEQRAIDRMGGMIAIEAEAETGLMTVSVTARDPFLAAALAARLVDKLRTRVQELLTQKAREDYEFIEERAEEAASELRIARAALAGFDDRNLGLTSARLLAERDRLRQEVAFAVDVFSQYQSELKQAEIELQRANPVITVLDRPVVPLEPARPRRKLIVLAAALGGLGLALVLAFSMEGYRRESESTAGRRKREAIRQALRPGWFVKSRTRDHGGRIDRPGDSSPQP